MKKGFLMLFAAVRKAAYYLLLFATFIMGIGFFLSFVSLFDLGKKPGEHLSLSFNRFYKQFKEVFSQLNDFKTQSISDYTTNSQVLDGYFHSYTILGISLVIIIVVGSLIAFTIMLSSFILRRKLRTFLDFFEGLPDLMFIFAINMLNIFLYQEYNMKIFKMYGLGSNQPIAFPVIVISFLPAILFGVFLLKAMEDEEEELYIQVGLAKGLTRGYLYFVHMLRNVLPVFTLKFRSILYMLLSNLVLVEFMYFYEQAFTSIILRHVFFGDHILLLLYTIMMLITPVILFEFLVRMIVKYTVVKKRGEIQL